MNMKCRIFVSIAAAISISTCVFGGEPSGPESPQEAAFDAAVDAYNICLADASGPLLPDQTKTPEVIAKESDAACGKSYGALSDAHLRFMLSKAPKAAQLQAVAYSMNRMSQYRAGVLDALTKKLASLRTQNAL